MSNELVERLESKIDALTELITDLRIQVGILKQSVNGGVGQSPECIQHRKDISDIHGQLRLYAGAMVIIIPLVNFLGPKLFNHLFP